MRGGLADLLHGGEDDLGRTPSSSLCGGVRRCGPHGVDGATLMTGSAVVAPLRIKRRTREERGTLGQILDRAVVPRVIRAMTLRPKHPESLMKKLFKNRSGGG